MYETDAEIAALQALLEASHASGSPHLKSIITDERRLSAAHLAALLTGMKLLSVATVTSSGEPRISALDGHFLHATWTFSTSGSSPKARQMAARPSVSVAHVDGEALAVFSHGTVAAMRAGDSDWQQTLDHWTTHYGSSPLSWGDDVVLYRYRPHWMVCYASSPAELLAARGITT